MKTLHICAIFHDVSNGPSFSVPAMIKALNESDVVSDLVNVTHERAKLSIVNKYPFRYFDHKDFSFKSIQDYDLVVFHQFWEKQFIGLAAYCCLKKIPYIIVPRGSLTKNALKRKWCKKLLFSPLYGLFALNAKLLHFLTISEQSHSLNLWRNTIVLPNGIDMSVDKVMDYPKDKLTYQRLLYLGRLDPYTKGLDRLLEAVAKSKKTFQQYDYILEMYGSDEPKGGKAVLEKLIQKYQLQDVVKIHQAVYGQEKEEIIKSATFFILPSRFEGHPMAAIECLSYGVPALVTRATNIADEVLKYRCGFVLEVDSFAQDLVDALQSRESIDHNGAKKLCAELFSWVHISAKLKQAYQKAINRNH